MQNKEYVNHFQKKCEIEMMRKMVDTSSNSQYFKKIMLNIEILKDLYTIKDVNVVSNRKEAALVKQTFTFKDL